MTLPNDDDYSYRNLRKSLPIEAMDPSAPPIETLFDHRVVFSKREEESNHGKSPVETPAASSKLKMIELELKKGQLMKAQQEIEKELIEKECEILKQVIQDEINLALLKFENSSCGAPSSYNIVPNGNIGNSGTSGSVRKETIPPTLPSVDGCEQLKAVGNVAIRHINSQGQCEVYEVVEPGQAQVIFRAYVTTGFLGGKWTTWLKLIDKYNSKTVAVFKAGRGNFMELYMHGQLACTMKKKTYLFSNKSMIICKHNGSTLFQVKAGVNEILNVQTTDKTNIGYINKGLMAAEILFGGVDGKCHDVLQFPVNLDLKSKVAIIACNFLVLCMYQ